MQFDFTPISIEDKHIFDEFFHRFEPSISELTFTNLYVWRNSRLIDYAVIDGIMLLRAEYDGQRYFLPPICDARNVQAGYEMLREAANDSCISLVKLIPEKHIAAVRQTFGISEDNDILVSDRDNYDYVYAADKLANLTSRKLSSKRNFIHRFVNQYKYSVMPYQACMRDDCIRLMQKWITGRTDDTGLRNEYIAIQNLLDDYERLDAIGSVIIVDGTIVSFAFGEPLSHDTFVIHFEKADTDYVGSHQMINKLFVSENVLPCYAFVNREQDLGHEGIRRAKMSYLPDRLVVKYTLQK